jgi:hypothetical protein
MPQATLAVDSVTLNSPNPTLSLTGGTPQAGRLILNGGIVNVPPESGARLKDTTIGGSGGQAFTGAATLDNVVVETDLWFYDGVGETFDNGLTLNDATLTLSAWNTFRNMQTISGHGTITMTSPGTAPELTASGGVVTIGSGITLEGGGKLTNSRGGYFVNNGTVRANSDAFSLSLQGSNVNNGLMEAVRDAG